MLIVVESIHFTTRVRRTGKKKYIIKWFLTEISGRVGYKLSLSLFDFISH